MLTKDQERAINAQIVALIESTEVGSYIRMSYSGIPEMAERNIEEDSANNMPELLEHRDKQIVDLRKELCRSNEEGGKALLVAEHERDTALANLRSLEEELETQKRLRGSLENQLTEAEQERDDFATQVADMGLEITRLKAMLFDYMMKERKV